MELERHASGFRRRRIHSRLTAVIDLLARCAAKHCAVISEKSLSSAPPADSAWTPAFIRRRDAQFLRAACASTRARHDDDLFARISKVTLWQLNVTVISLRDAATEPRGAIKSSTSDCEHRQAGVNVRTGGIKGGKRL